MSGGLHDPRMCFTLARSGELKKKIHGNTDGVDIKWSNSASKDIKCRSNLSLFPSSGTQDAVVFHAAANEPGKRQ